MPRLIAHYHGYLRNPPVEWQFMPMTAEGAPEFTARFPEAAAVFDNLHMLHDNIDDVLSRPDLYPTFEAKREAILRILPIYLHRNHEPQELYAEYHGTVMAGGQAGHGMMGQGRGGPETMPMGPRPPSAKDVLAGEASSGSNQKQPAVEEKSGGGHRMH